jgi:hypothetical protein
MTFCQSRLSLAITLASILILGFRARRGRIYLTTIHRTIKIAKIFIIRVLDQDSM